MRTRERPKYRAIYQADLAEELTGVSRETIRKRARRNNWTLAETILAYLSR